MSTGCPITLVGALTTAPKFSFPFSTELDLASKYNDDRHGFNGEQIDESERVVNSFGFFDTIIDGANAVTGVVVGSVVGAIAGAVRKPVETIISGLDISQIINAARGASLLTPDQIAILGANSSQFYSIVGTAVPDNAPPVQQTVSHAVKINKDFPSLWFVNFPKHMAAQDVEMVRQYRQNMTDFRSWSSQKWWEEVARRDGVPNDILQRARQSKIFAQVACEDMLKMSWLRTTKPPVNLTYKIQCQAHALHENLVAKVMQDWQGIDRDVVEAIEPLLQDIVRSARSGVHGQQDSELKVVILEKYEWDANTKGVTSFIRLISFELSEAFYNVVSNKSDPTTQVDVNLALLQYEAIFESSLWSRFTSSLSANQKDPFQEFIDTQTININKGQLK